jgi:hypothetical protein
MGVMLGLYDSGKNRLKVLENRLLVKIFEAMREKVIGPWRKLYN